jgi:hypothetical protein
MNGLAKPVLDRLGINLEPSVRDRVRAGIHLHAVLPRLDELARYDAEAGRIVREMRVAIEFRVLNGPRVVLHFADGRVRATRDGSSDVGLFFHSCALLNRMFDGEKVTPIPFKGLHRFKELERLTSLTGILPRYLKPSDKDMADPLFRARHVEMSLLVGLSAVREIAEFDPKGERVASHMPVGTIQYVIHGGPSCYVSIRKGCIEASSGTTPAPTSTIEIRDVDLTVALIKGEVDTFAANGSGAIKASGSLTLADEFNTLFDRVGLYLQ